MNNNKFQVAKTEANWYYRLPGADDWYVADGSGDSVSYELDKALDLLSMAQGMSDIIPDFIED